MASPFFGMMIVTTQSTILREGHPVSFCHSAPSPSSPDACAAGNEGPEDAGISCLLSMLKSVPDPRSPQGIQHALVFMLAACVVAALAGAKNYREIAGHAADVPQPPTPRTLGISACSGCCGLRVPCLSWCLFPGCAGGTRAWRDARVSRRVWRAVPRSAFPAGGRFLLPDGLLSWRRLAEAGCEHDDLWFPGDGCLGRGGVREFRACFLGAF